MELITHDETVELHAVSVLTIEHTDCQLYQPVMLRDSSLASSYQS